MYMNVQIHLLCVLNIGTLLQNTAYERHLYQTMKKGIHARVCVKLQETKPLE